MGKKVQIATKLKHDAVYGFLATTTQFSVGYGLLMVDAFTRATADEKIMTTLELVGDTMMRGGLLTGAFTAVCVNLLRFKYDHEAAAEVVAEALEKRLSPFKNDQKPD